MKNTKDNMLAKPNDEKNLTVYFDGSCPICSREIAYYQGQEATVPITWVDASATSAELPQGLLRDDALKRFHIRLPDQTLVSGAHAFACLWRTLPRFRILGSVAQLPGIRTILEWGYSFFLILRPRLQRATTSTPK